MPKTNVKVKLVGEDGNAFYIIGKVKKSLIKEGHQKLADEFVKQVLSSSDYEHLLRTVMDYVEIE